MNAPLHRRDFLKRGLGSGLILSALPVSRLASAIEPLQRPGKPRLLTSLAAYSFRDFFEDGNTKNAADRRIDLFQFIDYCADQGCAGTELTSYYFPKNPSPEFLLKLKHRAFVRGIAISGTAVGNNFALEKGPKRDEQIAMVKTWIDRALILGAPHIRVFAGSTNTLPRTTAVRLCVEALEECCDYAGTKGIFLGLENHGGIVAEADGVLEIVRAVNSSWFGVNLDTGNFRTDDPYGDLAKCAPYAVNVQLKSEITPRGGTRQQADFNRLTRILRESNYQGYVALEYEAAESPWTAVPPLLEQMRTAFNA